MEDNIYLRRLKCLDGLYYSFEMLDYSYSDLYELCIGIKEDSKKIIPALSKSWLFVDSVHRIREISQAIPGLSGNNKELKEFLNITKLTKFYRNYTQHLRRELSKKEINPFPAWGNLAWVDPKDSTRSYIAMIGIQINKTGYAGSVYDRIEKKWVSKVCLNIENKSYNFDLIYNACNKFKAFIIPWILSNNKFKLKFKQEIPIITVSIVQN